MWVCVCKICASFLRPYVNIARINQFHGLYRLFYWTCICYTYTMHCVLCILYWQPLSVLKRWFNLLFSFFLCSYTCTHKQRDTYIYKQIYERTNEYKKKQWLMAPLLSIISWTTHAYQTSPWTLSLSLAESIFDSLHLSLSVLHSLFVNRS